MTLLRKFIIAVIASSVFAVGAMAAEPQKGNEKPPPPKEKKEVRQPPKDPPPPRDKGNQDGRRGGKP